LTVSPLSACSGLPMTVRGGGVPAGTMAFMPSVRMGPPPRSLLPMRITASWFGSLAHRIQGCGTNIRGTTRGLPSNRHPTTASLPSCSVRRATADGWEVPAATSVAACSKPSRDGLTAVEKEAEPSQRPPLTASARAAKRAAMPESPKGHVQRPCPQVISAPPEPTETRGRGVNRRGILTPFRG
jgi:hypothetical protein